MKTGGPRGAGLRKSDVKAAAPPFLTGPRPLVLLRGTFRAVSSPRRANSSARTVPARAWRRLAPGCKPLHETLWPRSCAGRRQVQRQRTSLSLPVKAPGLPPSRRLAMPASCPLTPSGSGCHPGASCPVHLQPAERRNGGRACSLPKTTFRRLHVSAY